MSLEDADDDEAGQIIARTGQLLEVSLTNCLSKASLQKLEVSLTKYCLSKVSLQKLSKQQHV